MDEEFIDVIIHPDGRVEIKVEGLKGETCIDLTHALEAKLGGIINRELTHEFHERAADDQNKQRLGF